MKSPSTKNIKTVQQICDLLSESPELPSSETLEIINNTVGVVLGARLGFVTDHKLTPIGVCVIQQNDLQTSSNTSGAQGVDKPA